MDALHANLYLLLKTILMALPNLNISIRHFIPLSVPLHPPSFSLCTIRNTLKQESSKYYAEPRQSLH